MQCKCTDYPILHHTYKEVPIDRANRHTMARHRHTQERTHMSVTRLRAVAKGSQVGPAEPLVRPNLDWHQSRCASAGDSPLSSSRRLSTFPYLEMAGTDLSRYKQGLHTLSHISHSLSFSYTRRKSSSSAPLVSLEQGVCEQEDRRRAGLVGLSSSCTSMDTIRLSSSSGKFLVQYS